MDIDSYPEESELEKIASWPDSDLRGLMDYVHDRWKYADVGFWTEENGRYEISTGGWSGNESLIEALQEHPIFWDWWWYSSRRGGHYVFLDPARRKLIDEVLSGTQPQLQSIPRRRSACPNTVFHQNLEEGIETGICDTCGAGRKENE